MQLLPLDLDVCLSCLCRQCQDLHQPSQSCCCVLLVLLVLATLLVLPLALLLLLLPLLCHTVCLEEAGQQRLAPWC